MPSCLTPVTVFEDGHLLFVLLLDLHVRHEVALGRGEQTPGITSRHRALGGATPDLHTALASPGVAYHARTGGELRDAHRQITPEWP